MSESRQVENESGSGAAVDPERLKLEAAALRKSDGLRRMRGRRYSPVQKMLAALLMAFAVAGSIFLLINEEGRRRLVVGLSDEWARLSDRDRDVFKLPPPPPRQVLPKVVQAPNPVVIGGDSGLSGTIYSVGEDPDDKVQKSFVLPPKTAEADAAFRLLKAELEAAARLVDGQAPGLQFKEWRSVRNQPPVFFIDLVAVRESDRKEVHFVWSVDLQQNKIEALSQAARDLK